MSFAIYAVGMSLVAVLLIFRRKIWTKDQRRDPISIELRVCYWIVAAIFMAGLVVLIKESV